VCGSWAMKLQSVVDDVTVSIPDFKARLPSRLLHPGNKTGTSSRSHIRLALTILSSYDYSHFDCTLHPIECSWSRACLQLSTARQLHPAYLISPASTSPSPAYCYRILLRISHLTSRRNVGYFVLGRAHFLLARLDVHVGRHAHDMVIARNATLPIYGPAAAHRLHFWYV
jgi:hypothetical protein